MIGGKLESKREGNTVYFLEIRLVNTLSGGSGSLQLTWPISKRNRHNRAPCPERFKSVLTSQPDAKERHEQMGDMAGMHGTAERGRRDEEACGFFYCVCAGTGAFSTERAAQFFLKLQ